jgi:putative two-component system response regulator
MKDEHTKPTILVVDDTIENIDVLKGILEAQYSIRAATNGELALKICEKIKPDLILLDVMMPNMNGYEVCRILKSNVDTAHIPVIFVTAMTDANDEQRGFDMGAVDYITKPVHPAKVLSRVHTHITLSDQQRACQEQVRIRTKSLEESQRAAINMLGEAGHYNDTDTGVHIWRMSAYASALARAAHWPIEKVGLLALSAPMHDTGKIGISDAILKAPRKLTPNEWAIMKTHTEIGHKILSMSSTPLFTMAAEIALCHHEKWDGSGYPNGLTGEQIPQSARIVAIADVFDALTMIRPYKSAWPVEKSLETISCDANNHFDPELVECFLGIQPEILEIKKMWDEKS